MITILILYILSCDSYINHINNKNIYTYMNVMKINKGYHTILKKEDDVVGIINKNSNNNDQYSNNILLKPLRYLVTNKSLYLTEIINGNRYNNSFNTIININNI